MPNQPKASTVTVSFTLPRVLAEAVDRAAAAKMTNKSDIIRRALMNYLPPEDVARIASIVAEEAAHRANTRN